MPLQPGDILDGRYEILARLGAGGMGELYKASHTLLGATRVIKVIHPQISGNTDAQDRFAREARVATKVQHPNVATLHDFAALPGGAHYMVWEYIDGENLAQHLRARGALPAREAIGIALQVLNGLESIHRAGIVHRDISPENLMLDATGTVKIIDLGVAKLDDADAVSQTRTGIFVGKLRYASPEQLGFLPEGEKIDARVDIYALGMVLFELLTGRPPYEAKSPHEYFILHAREPQVKSVELPVDLPGAAVLQPILEKALARSRNERFASAREMAAALEVAERALAATTNQLATIAAPFDGDATLKVATTVRTAVSPMPMRSGGAIAALIAGVVLLGLTLTAIAMWPWSETDSAPPAEPIIAAAAAPRHPSSSISVTESAPLAEPQQTTTTATTAAPAAEVAEAAPPVEPDREKVEEPAPRKKTPPAPERQGQRTAEKREKEEREPVRTTAASTAHLDHYVDGGDDGRANDRAIIYLREQVRGIKRVEVVGGSMQDVLIRSLRDHMPHLEIGESNVVIRFEGTFERLGRGRKRRAAEATVLKNGRPVFRYTLPDEVFRVGMLPHDAFARVLSDAFLR